MHSTAAPANQRATWPRRLMLLACAALLPLAAQAAAASPADPPPRPPTVVQAPHYGDVLWRFYQDQYFSALTSLMASQTIGRLNPHDDEAEVLRGGLLLSYGMHREAGQVFERLIERGAEPSVRRRAWFFLAKIRYQRGLMPQADEALSRIDAALPAPQEDQRQLLQAQVSMAQGQFSRAAELLRALATRQNEFSRTPTAAEQEADTTTRYARFNLGVALVRSGDVAGGQRWLNELGQAPAANEEQRTLRDQANLALGFSGLQAQQHAQARQWLERVRLNSAHANAALLGLGWAELGQNRPQQALVPWMTLSEQSGNDAALLEARLAVAHALGQAGATGAALAQYQQTLLYFSQEEQRLDETVASLRQSNWLDALLALNPDQDMNWQRAIGALPPELPYPAHLTPVLAQHDFQELFKNQRDLLVMERNLLEWQANLSTYRDVLEHRRRIFAQRLPAARKQAGDVSLSGWRKQQQSLSTELDGANAQADGLAFADERQSKLLARVNSARNALQAAGPDADASLATEQERLRLLSGLLSWDVAQSYTERAWLTRKALQRTDAELAQAQTRLAELANAEREQNARFNTLGGRLDGLATQLRELLPQLQTQRQAQQEALQELAVAVLTRQKQRLAGYASQARFAIAQLHDRALAEQEGDHAPTR